MSRHCAFLILSAVCFAQVPGPSFGAQPAVAANAARPLIGPAAEWVLPAAIPSAPTAADGAATVDLLNDVQARLTNAGDSTYYGIAFKIASPQGLDDAALQLTWDPALETLTIHRYRIVRDGKIIDLLGDGSNLSVIQRETNLESATLDGRLTASMQPADVRVGDTIEFAFTRTRRDPALGGKSEALIGPNDGTPYGRLRVRITWPDGKMLKWRAYPGILQPKLTHSPAGNELVADVTNVTTPEAPRGAPSRFLVVNAIDVSEFPDWAAVSETMLPLYSRAATLNADSPVKAQAQRIAAVTSDPQRRAEMALALVQEQIRYLFLGMDDGGYVPAAADLTWSRRFGDCKGKAILLVALLRELGIDAEPVLVNTRNGDLVAHRLPAVAAFDHVIVRARIAGRTYWMDGTRLGDTNLARLETPPYHYGLPVAANTSDLVALAPDPLTAPSETISLSLDASAGIDAPAKASGEMRFRGSGATDMRMKYAGLSAADRQEELRKLWRKNYDFVSPASITTVVDEKSGDFVISMTGSAKMDWMSDAGTRWYEVDRARLGWKLDIDRPGAINKDAPFEIQYPDYWESRETIKLPASAAASDFALQGGSIDQQVGGVYAFHRKVGISGGILTMESSTRAIAPELPAEKAEQARDQMAAMASEGVYVRVPDDYMATAADIAALQGNKPALAMALLHRGAVHFDRNELANSVADEAAAIVADPTSAPAHSILALALALQQDAKADATADKAIALDPDQSLAWRAKGVVAMNESRYADAESNYSRQLKIDPKDGQALASRASARLLLGRFSDALVDADSALAIAPGLKMHMVRSAILAGLGRNDDALAEADRALQLQPDNDGFRQVRAEMRVRFGRRDLAIADYEELIEKSPKVDYYLARAELWPDGDSAKRDADIAAALALDAHSAKALSYRASFAIRSGDYRSAEKDIAAIEKADPNSKTAYQLKLQLLSKQERGKEALELVDSFIAKHPGDASALNERCWTKATLDIQLDTAIADCDASLKLSPNNPATLDSRGFAKLRLGATDAAIADYDAALKLAPELPASLYGRAIARARKGDNVGARADLAEATKLSPDIESRFAGFGVILPPTLAEGPKADQGQPK